MQLTEAIDFFEHLQNTVGLLRRRLLRRPVERRRLKEIPIEIPLVAVGFSRSQTIDWYVNDT